MHQIRYFLAVAEHLNFTRAAEACHVAQPSLTRAIRKLEEELGGELFRRERRATHITDLGRMMLPLLSQSYTVAGTARDLAGSYASGNVAPFALIVSRAIDLAPFLPALAEIARVFPGLRLRLGRDPASAVLECLRAGDAELAIAGDLDEDWARLDRWPLFTETARLYVHRDNPLARRQAVGAGEIDVTCWLDRPYCPDAMRWTAALEDLGAVLPCRFDMADDSDVGAFIDRDLGVCILPETARRPDSLAPVAVEGLEAGRTVRLYGVAGRQRSQAATAFMKLLRSADLLH